MHFPSPLLSLSHPSLALFPLSLSPKANRILSVCHHSNIVTQLTLLPHTLESEKHTLPCVVRLKQKHPIKASLSHETQ